MTDHERLARATILFLRGNAWTPQDHADWRTYTGSPLVLVRVLVNLAEKVLANECSTKPDSPGEVRDVSSLKPSFTDAAKGGVAPLHHYSPEERALWTVEPDSQLDHNNR